MATAAEAAQDMSRVLDALNKARQYFEALDKADQVRAASALRSQPSALRIELGHAETAGERVSEYLSSQTAIELLNPRDGGPL